MTVRLLADENFNRHIMTGLRRRTTALDIVTVQSVEPTRAADAAVLEWAARADRVLLTHDVNTMPTQAYERIQAGLAMPGCVLVPALLPMNVAIEELLWIVEASETHEWADQVVYLPLTGTQIIRGWPALLIAQNASARQHMSIAWSRRIAPVARDCRCCSLDMRAGST